MALAMLPTSAQRIVATNTTIDCGRVGFEQPVTATYELRNKGKRRLVIESVRTDCGCTAVDFPKEVAAGDNFTIKMTYDARQLGISTRWQPLRATPPSNPST